METNPAAHLKPLGMGQIIDRAVRLYRQNFVQYVGIVALAQIPMLIFSATFPLFTLGMESAALDMQIESFLGLGVLSMVSVLVGAVLTQVAAAAMTQAIGDTYLGRPTTIIEAFSRIGSAWWQLLVAFILLFVLSIVLFIWTLIPCVGWLTGPGIMIFGAVVAVPLIVPVVVLERGSGVDAIGRAWQLARRRFWWLLGFMLLLSLLSQIIVTGPSLLASSLVLPLLDSDLGLIAQNVVQSVSSVLLNILYLPLYTACVALLYFDIRVRTEGLDLALLAASRAEPAGEEEKTAVSPPTLTAHLTNVPAPPQSLTPTRDEWINFIAISVGLVVLYILLVGLFMLLVFGGLALLS